MNDTNEPSDAPEFPADLERALTEARDRPLAAPEFQGVLDRLEAGRIGGDPKLVAAARWMRAAAIAFFAMTTVLIVVNLMDGTALGFRSPDSDTVTFSSGLRRSLANLASPILVAVAGPALLVPAIALLVGASRITSGRFADGVLGRAVAWSSLIVGVVITSEFGNPLYVLTGMIVAWCSGRALLVARERGLEDVTAQGTAFQPVAFRGPLVVALIMAWADALTLVFSGVLQCRWLIDSIVWVPVSDTSGNYWYAPFATLACGFLMVIAVAGLFRLKVWALFLNILANVGIAALAVSDHLRLPGTVILTVVTTAGIQLLLPVPVLAAALGDDNAGNSWLHRMGHRAGYVAVCVLMIVCIPAASMSSGRRGYLEAGGFATASRAAPRIAPPNLKLDRNYEILRDEQGRRLEPATASGELFPDLHELARFKLARKRQRQHWTSPAELGGWRLRSNFPRLESRARLRIGTVQLPSPKISLERAYYYPTEIRVFVDLHPRLYPSTRSEAPTRGHIVFEYVEPDGTRHLDALTIDDHGGWFEVCPPGTCGPDPDPATLIETPGFRWEAAYP